jgi:hypothetical protein
VREIVVGMELIEEMKRGETKDDDAEDRFPVQF